MIEKKIRVAHISTPFTWRGGEQQIAYLYKGIDELNALGAFGQIEQYIFCPVGSELEAYANNLGWNVRTFKKRAGTDPFSAAELKRLSSELELDLVHAHDSHAHTMAVLSASIFRNRTPLVVSRRVDFPLKRKPKTRFKYNHKSIRKIICVSQFITKLVKPHVYRSTIDVVTVHSGVELERKVMDKGKLRKEFNITANRCIVANTSELADHKDYFTFLETAAKVQKKEPGKFVFVIIGTGPLMQELKSKKAELGLTDKDVIFTGFRKDLPQLWPDIDLFLFTSKTEGLGTSVLDAFYHDAPVIATAAGGITELVKHGETGMISPIGDSDSLSENLVQVWKDEALYNQLAGSAKAFLSQFDRKITAQHTVLHYRDALK